MTAVKLSGFPAKPLYQILAGLVQARHNCQVSRNDEWFFRHGLRAQALVKRFLPSGSGWDNAARRWISTGRAVRSWSLPARSTT
jgi:hypothetical protein